jgi:hypothetical protein
MIITLQPNETLWSEDGYHVLNELGIAIKVQVLTEVDIASQENYDRAWNIIKEQRALQGLNPETGLIEVSNGE